MKHVQPRQGISGFLKHLYTFTGQQTTSYASTEIIRGPPEDLLSTTPAIRLPAAKSNSAPADDTAARPGNGRKELSVPLAPDLSTVWHMPLEWSRIAWMQASRDGQMRYASCIGDLGGCQQSLHMVTWI